jgi:threonine synthase
MRFLSTRSAATSTSFSGALEQGLAPDGGLYLPQDWPQFDAASMPSAADLAGLATQVLAPFAAGDVLEAALPQCTREAFNFPAPLVPLQPGAALSVLELFHGPTAAFKDFGARFLAACFARLPRAAGQPLKILVATSGDTGGAVAAAFHRRAGAEVAVLFPQGLVSPTQQRQLTCWGDNVRSFAVHGTFDDCQRLVKQAFLDPVLRGRFTLSSANSINVGRLLPQIVYYAATGLAVWRERGAAPSFVIPSGNLGNCCAALLARRLGFPVGRIVLAHNANRTVVDFLESGQWAPRASIATPASAMDVGDPSNMERLRALLPDLASLREALSAYSVDDEAIRARIRADYARYGRVWCPHSATAAEVYERLPAGLRAAGPWVLVATAHPAKFREIVEPLIGREVPVPLALQQLLDRPVKYENLSPDLASLRAALM